MRLCKHLVNDINIIIENILLTETNETVHICEECFTNSKTVSNRYKSDFSQWSAHREENHWGLKGDKEYYKKTKDVYFKISNASVNGKFVVAGETEEDVLKNVKKNTLVQIFATHNDKEATITNFGCDGVEVEFSFDENFNFDEKQKNQELIIKALLKRLNYVAPNDEFLYYGDIVVSDMVSLNREYMPEYYMEPKNDGREYHVFYSGKSPKTGDKNSLVCIFYTIDDATAFINYKNNEMFN